MTLNRIWTSWQSHPELEDDDDDEEEGTPVSPDTKKRRPVSKYSDAQILFRLPKSVAALKNEKFLVGGTSASQLVYAAFVRSTFKTGEHPGDELFQVDDDLIDILLSHPSILSRMSTRRWELLQAMLVMADHDSIIFKNKDRYMQALQCDEADFDASGQIFQYLVDMVDPRSASGQIFQYLVDMVDPRCAGQSVDFPSIGAKGCHKLKRLKYQSSSPVTYNPNISGASGKRILCLDGGGIRGLVTVEILKRLEGLCQEKTEQKSNVTEYFDLIAGTSTGGFIALALATKKSLGEIRDFYFRMKNKVFVGTKPYKTPKLDEIFKDFFGSTTKMSEIQDVKVVVTSVYGSVQDLRLKLFTNFSEDTMNEEVWKVARRTTSAPGYFDPMQEDSERADGVTEFFDGGFSANNPTLKILTRFGNMAKNGIIISLGTGKLFDRNEPLPRVRTTLHGKTTMLLNGDLEKFASAFINQVTKTDGDLVEDCLELCKNYDAQFYRLTPTLAEEVALDEGRDHKILNMLWHAKAFGNKHHHIFQQMAERIVVPQQEGAISGLFTNILEQKTA